MSGPARQEQLSRTETGRSIMPSLPVFFSWLMHADVAMGAITFVELRMHRESKVNTASQSTATTPQPGSNLISARVGQMLFSGFALRL